MKKNPTKYPCKCCEQKEAIITHIFITNNLRFRAKLVCKICLNKFEITINGEDWKNKNYSYKEVALKIAFKLLKLKANAKEIIEKG